MSFFKLGRHSKTEKVVAQASEKSQSSDAAATSTSRSGWPTISFSISASIDAPSSSSNNKSSNGGKQKSLHSLLKSSEKEYKTKIQAAEKTRDKLLKEADKVAKKERAVIKAKKDQADNEAKKEFYTIKDEASEVHVRIVLDAVKYTILDLKEQQQREQKDDATAESTALDHIKTDIEIKKWTDYAAQTVRPHITPTRFQQRLLDEVLEEVTKRQKRAQREALEQSTQLHRDLEQQVQETQRQLQQQRLGETSRMVGELESDEAAPPSYNAAVSRTPSITEKKKLGSADEQ